MPSSKIIRDRHYDHQAKPLALQEAAVSALYQSDWARANSNIIRDAADISVRAFPLFDTSAPPTATEGTRVLPQTRAAEPSSGQSVESDTSAPPTDPAGDALYAKAHEQAQVLLQQAQEEAQRCLTAARAQVDQLATEAYESGLRRGEAEALRENRELYASVLRCFEHAAAEVTGLRQQVMRQAEDDIITLAFAIARKLVQHHVQVDPDCLTTTLRRALAYVLDDDAIVVRVHPDDLARTQHLHEDILPSFQAMRHVTIETDETVGRGGCIVEANVGVIDARVTSQFAELEQRFREQYTLKTEAQVR